VILKTSATNKRKRRLLTLMTTPLNFVDLAARYKAHTRVLQAQEKGWKRGEKQVP